MSNEKGIELKILTIGDFVMHEEDNLIYKILELPGLNVRLVSSDESLKSIRETAYSWEWCSDLSCWFIRRKPEPLLSIDKGVREYEPGTARPGFLGSNNGVANRKPGVYEGVENTTGGLNNKAGLQHPPRTWGNW